MKSTLSKITWLTFVMLIIASLTMISCGSPNTTNQPVSTQQSAATAPATVALTPKSGGVLKFVPANVANAFGYGNDFVVSGSLESIYPCVETIFGVDAGGKFVPTKLSTAYQVSPDGKAITLTLRKGVKFHDGSDFNAQVAKWNLDILKKVKNPGTEAWTSVDVVDDYSIRLNLKSFNNTFLNDLNAAAGQIISQASVEKNGEQWAHTHLVGTGPFKFVSFTPDVGLKFERNDNYWGEKPLLDGIEIIFIKDDMAKSAAVQAGEVDIVSNITSESAISLRDKGYNTGFGQPPVIQFMFPDSANADSPLSNLKVRQAIEYAIDRNAVSQLGNGMWKVINQPCEPDSPGYITNFEGRKYDPEKAKQLLAEAGYANGFKITFIYRTSMSTPDSMVAIQQYLSKVGITVDLQVVTGPEGTEYQENGWKNGFILYNAWAGSNYLSSTTRNLSPGGIVFVSTAKPDGFKDLLNEATVAMDPATYVAACQKINMALYENSTVIPLWESYRTYFVMQPWVKDANFHQKWGPYDWTTTKAWLNK